MMVHARRTSGGYRLEADASGVVVDQANSFLDALVARDLSPDTIRAYAFDLALLFRWMLRCHLDVGDLHDDRLLEFVRFQQQAGAQPSSINRRLVTTELFYRFVTGEDLGIRRVPLPGPHYKGRGRERALGLHLMKKRRRKLRLRLVRRIVEPLDASQVRAFLRSLRRYRDLAIVHLMLLCGLRSSEVLSLRLQDVCLDERRLRVRGKGKRERVLPLADLLASLLVDYLRFERPSGRKADEVFLVLQGRRRGEPMTRTGLRSLFRHRRQARKVLRNANAHRFRHTFGADMARAGVRLPVLQRLMGHADGLTTLQYINLSMVDIAHEYARAIDIIEKRYEQR